jgi:tricorn protease interacting factor F2/3
MENWGAITFRENLLLHYPEITSKAGEDRICEVIAHEIVHQWFGNLVSPADWKYLWLNESFATYFAYGVVDHYHPQWDVWEQFLFSQMNTALARDGLQETFPIEIPGGEHVVINTATAPIIYNKGGSILHQIQTFIGDPDFRKGLQHYLNTHQYDCATSENLWESFEAVSNQPVTRIMKSWIEQPGYPVLEVNREENRLFVTQKRFSYLSFPSDQEWIVPITVRVFHRDGGSERLVHLLEGKDANIHLPSDALAYKVNDGQSGFFRVRYLDNANLQHLGELVSTQSLPPGDRWGIQNDLYAFVRCGQISVKEYLAFLATYSNEHDFLPLISIRDNLLHAYLTLEGEEKERIASVGKSLLEAALSQIGYEPAPEEKHTTSILRDHILAHAVLYGSGRARDFATSLFEGLLNGRSVHPDLLKSVMQVGARFGDGTTFDWLVRRLESSESEHDRMNILQALAEFRDPQLLDRVLDYALDEVPSRNKFIPLVALASNPDTVPRLWDWYTSRLEDLEQLHPLHYERVIAGIVSIGGLGRESVVRDFFGRYMQEKPLAKDAVKLSLEQLEINSRMRRLHRRGMG